MDSIPSPQTNLFSGNAQEGIIVHSAIMYPNLNSKNNIASMG